MVDDAEHDSREDEATAGQLLNVVDKHDEQPSKDGQVLVDCCFPGELQSSEEGFDVFWKG